jgi:hypothetical protein
MSDEQSQLQGKEVTLTLRGSLQKLEDVIRTVVEVANNHEIRYQDTWLQQDPEALKILLQDKMGRKLRFQHKPADKMEEVIDGVVYGMMYLYHLQQEDPDFTYPDRTMKRRRDGANV